MIESEEQNSKSIEENKEKNETLNIIQPTTSSPATKASLPLNLENVVTTIPKTMAQNYVAPQLPVSRSFVHDLLSKSPGTAITSIVALFVLIILSIVVPTLFSPCNCECPACPPTNFNTTAFASTDGELDFNDP